MKVGDVVRLNSGGPLMTVYRRDINQVGCAWFYDGSVTEWLFPPEALYVTADYDEDDEDMSDEELDELMAWSELKQYGSR